MSTANIPETEISSLTKRRKRLKQELWRTRALRASGLPMCPICGNEIVNWQGGQMHEVFLTRGDAQKLKEYIRFKIYEPENCVIVCDETCHVQAATQDGKILCARQILLFEGYHQVKAWLQRSAMDWKGTQPEIESRYIFELMLTLTLSPVYIPRKDASALIHVHQPRWNANDFK